MTPRLTVHDGELKRYAVQVRCVQPPDIEGGVVLVFATSERDACAAAIDKMWDKYLRHQNKRTTWITVGEPEEA
jgi:hypothetical protein